MTHPNDTAETIRDDDSQVDIVFELDHALIDAVDEALAAGDEAAAKQIVEPLHDADVADLLQHLNPERRRQLVIALRDAFHPDVLAELDETVRDEVIDALGLRETAAAVAGLETDDALNVIAELDEDEQRKVLAAIPAAERLLIEEALAYPEDSAGRLMQRELVAVPSFWTVGETIDFLRAEADKDDNVLPEHFYDLYVVDPSHRPVGSIPLSVLLRSRRHVAIADIMKTDMKVINATVDQEDVAFLFRQRDLTSAPVVDDAGRLVGVITIDDVVDVIDEEHEHDIMHLGGVKEDDLYSAAVDTVKSRFAWLLVNLGTAIVASIVIGLFDATIGQMVALAVLMPIVASMGGNAGTQTMTVAVRGLATKELTKGNALRVISKELFVGGINGVLFALITGAVAWLWFGDPGIAVVIGAAMIVNMIVAALSGATIPLLLERARIDPAIASGVVLTTVTDVVGFFAFLGLAAWLLM